MAKFATLRDMINWCIEKPNQGEKIDPESEAMKALEAYIDLVEHRLGVGARQILSLVDSRGHRARRAMRWQRLEWCCAAGSRMWTWMRWSTTGSCGPGFISACSG